jgi:hypothetical protein
MTGDTIKGRTEVVNNSKLQLYISLILPNVYARPLPGLGSDHLHSGRLAQGILHIGMYGLSASDEGTCTILVPQRLSSSPI